MIDVHTHILPNLDDGPDSVDMSIEMLKESKAQGINTVISTSHCYLREEKDIEIFLSKRESSYQTLKQAIEKETAPLPNILLGSEVHIENDVSGFKGLDKLCIEGTNYILIELPYRRWNVSLYDTLFSMTIRHMNPIIAHVERFFDHEKEFENLRDIDLIYQINGESILSNRAKRVISHLFRKGMVNLIGSDTHNTASRRQNLKAAYDKIEKNYGAECSEYLKNNAKLLIENQSVDCFRFKKLGFFEKHKDK